jgi:hypothetical protein
MDVAVSATNAVQLIRGNGAGGVLSSTNIAVTGTLRGIAAVNIDGVNGTDILVASSSSNSVARLLNNGAGGFTVTNNFVAALPGALEMASADFNGDARPDFIVTSATSGATISACRNNAGTSYICNNITSPQVNCSVATGDVNSDGKMDFVLASPSSNVVMAYTGDGAFNFTQNATNALATRLEQLQARRHQQGRLHGHRVRKQYQSGRHLSWRQHGQVPCCDRCSCIDLYAKPGRGRSAQR